MREIIARFIKECGTCQRNKGENVSSPGLLQPLDIPSQVWSSVSIDFIKGFLKSGGYTTILVIVDMLTKYSHFIPLAHPFTARDMAKSFFDNVVKLQGVPRSIVSDRDKIF